MLFLTHHLVREVSLADLDGIADRLCGEIARSGFRPDCVVYLETAARLLAVLACNRFGAGAVALHTQRCGTRAKHRLAPLLRRLPRPFTNALRGWESRLAYRPRRRQRIVVLADPIDLPACRVLVLDDAADSGASVQSAKHWVLSGGTQPADVRVATVTATSPLAAEVVDFCLYRDLCRFPWSSDSPDLPAYHQLYHAARVPAFRIPGARETSSGVLHPLGRAPPLV
jgi:uncharacterized protein